MTAKSPQVRAEAHCMRFEDLFPLGAIIDDR
jgi:hypothetical protein